MKNSRLPVYWVIKIAKAYQLDVDKICAYWANRRREWVQAALHYYEAYPGEIDTQISLYDQVTADSLKRKLPQMEIYSVSNSEAHEG
jgi:hypothetical protein